MQQPHSTGGVVDATPGMLPLAAGAPAPQTPSALLSSARASPVGDTAAAYRLAHEQRSFEISQLTNRNNFFMVFQGVLLAGLVQSQGAASPVINFFVCVAGMIMSIFQAGMASGAKYWQIRWEVAVKRLELLLIEDLRAEPRAIQLFTCDKAHLDPNEQQRIQVVNREQARQLDRLSEESNYIDSLVKGDLALGGKRSIAKWTISRRYSVSKIPFYAGVCLFVVWTGLWLSTFAIAERTLPQYLLGWLGGSFSFVGFAKVGG